MKLKDLKFKCILDSIEKRKVLQEVLFKIGIMWTDERDMTVKRLKEPLYCVDRKKLFYYSNTERYTEDPVKELSYVEALAEIAKVVTEPRGRWVDFDIDEQGFFKINTQPFNVYMSPSRPVERCSEIVKAFGGIQYMEPISGDVSDFVGHAYIEYSNGTFAKRVANGVSRGLPVYPYKIRFWMEEGK